MDAAGVVSLALNGLAVWAPVLQDAKEVHLQELAVAFSFLAVDDPVAWDEGYVLFCAFPALVASATVD